jgi:hypothetical protein
MDKEVRDHMLNDIKGIAGQIHGIYNKVSDVLDGESLMQSYLTLRVLSLYIARHIDNEEECKAMDRTAEIMDSIAFDSEDKERMS